MLHLGSLHPTCSSGRVNDTDPTREFENKNSNPTQSEGVMSTSSSMSTSTTARDERLPTNWHALTMKTFSTKSEAVTAFTSALAEVGTRVRGLDGSNNHHVRLACASGTKAEIKEYINQKNGNKYKVTKHVMCDGSEERCRFAFSVGLRGNAFGFVESSAYLCHLNCEKVAPRVNTHILAQSSSFASEVVESSSTSTSQIAVLKHATTKFGENGAAVPSNASLYRALTKVKEKSKGDVTLNYTRLISLLEAWAVMNPGSHAVLAFNGVSPGGNQRVLTIGSPRVGDEGSTYASEAPVSIPEGFVPDDDVEISFDGEAEGETDPGELLAQVPTTEDIQATNFLASPTATTGAVPDDNEDGRDHPLTDGGATGASEAVAGTASVAPMGPSNDAARTTSSATSTSASAAPSGQSAPVPPRAFILHATESLNRTRASGQRGQDSSSISTNFASTTSARPRDHDDGEDADFEPPRADRVRRRGRSGHLSLSDDDASRDLQVVGIVLVPGSTLAMAKRLFKSHSLDGAFTHSIEHGSKMISLTGKSGLDRIEVLATGMVPAEDLESLDFFFHALAESGELRVRAGTFSPPSN